MEPKLTWLVALWVVIPEERSRTQKRENVP